MNRLAGDRRILREKQYGPGNFVCGHETNGRKLQGMDAGQFVAEVVERVIKWSAPRRRDG